MKPGELRVCNSDASWIRRGTIILIVSLEDVGWAKAVNFIIDGRLARDTGRYIEQHTELLGAA